MASHLRCLLFHENGDFRGRVLVRIGGLYKTHNAVTGKRAFLRNIESHVILSSWETREPRRLTLLKRRGNPPDERKEGMPMYVTYEDLIQVGIFIVALVSLIYQIIRERK